MLAYIYEYDPTNDTYSLVDTDDADAYFSQECFEDGIDKTVFMREGAVAFGGGAAGSFYVSSKLLIPGGGKPDLPHLYNVWMDEWKRRGKK